MPLHEPSRAKAVLVCLSIALSALLAGCGSGGGGGGELPLMVDSLGRTVAEADFGGGDPAAAGADGTALDEQGQPIANAQVSLADNAGTTRPATTDASGYYRVVIKGMTPPFLVKLKRGDGSEWYSPSNAVLKTRGFVTINVSGLTDKVAGYVADAVGTGGGAAAAVTPALLASNGAALAAATTRVSTGLAASLAATGFDPASYDPVATPLAASASDRHAALLRSLAVRKNAQGRTVVAATVAGKDGGFVNGNGTAASLNLPASVAVDAAGNVFVADTGNHAIRRISRSGAVATLAGNGEPGFAEGSGSAARFNAPSGIAIDGVGNLYVADSNNNRIRKVTPAGEVTTFAGSGAEGFANGTGAGASFSAPSAIAIDGSGNLYVSDSGNDSVRKLTAAGGVTTLAGIGPITTAAQFAAQGFNNVQEIAVGAAGTVYVNAHCGFVTTFRLCLLAIAPDGVVTKHPTDPHWAARFFPFGGLAVDAAANVYAGYKNTLVKLTPAGVQTLLLGDEAADPVTAPRAVDRFNGPRGIALDSFGNLVVADTGNSVVKLVLP